MSKITYNQVTLQQAIRSITSEPRASKDPTSEAEMSKKLGISIDQFRAYVRGDETPPADLPGRLLSAYNLRIVTATSKTNHTPPPPTVNDLPKKD